jgi:hypothetical protein
MTTSPRAPGSPTENLGATESTAPGLLGSSTQAIKPSSRTTAKRVDRIDMVVPPVMCRANGTGVSVTRLLEALASLSNN